MTDEYLTLEQVMEDLQMTEPQVKALVSSGQLSAIDIEGEQKFLRTAVVDYKERVEGKETVVFEGEDSGGVAADDETDFEMAPDSDAVRLEDDETDIADETNEKTGKLDLSDIDEEAGADESDQTSVLQPVGGAAGTEEVEDEPVFEFEEDESTSLFTEAPVAAEEEAPAEIAEMPSVGDEMEEGETISLSPEDLELEEVELSETDEPSHTEMVADILREETGTGEEDDSLETVDLAELEGGTEDMGEESLLAEGSAADTQLVDDGMISDTGDEETIGLADAEGEGVGLDVSEDRLAEEEEEELTPISLGPTPAPVQPVHQRTGGDYAMVKPSILANIMLFLSIFVTALGGYIAVSAYLGHTSPVTEFVKEQLKNL